MRRSRSPASSYCTAPGRDSSDWDVGRSAVIRFAPDSPLEGTEFEPSVPLLRKALLGVAIGDGGTKGGATYKFRSENGNACLAWLPTAFPFAEGPRVRIRLPPAASPLRTNFSRGGSRTAFSRSRRPYRACAWSRRRAARLQVGAGQHLRGEFLVIRALPDL